MELNESRLAELAAWFFDPEALAPIGITGEKADVASGCFEQLFLRAPEAVLDIQAAASFEALLKNQQPSAAMIDYRLPYPKFEFLRYLTKKGYHLHGTKSSELSMLEPRQQMDWNDRPLRAVFATCDAIWPMYFALLNRQALTGSLRNGCFLVEHAPSHRERFYFFSVNQEDLTSNIWSDGFVYILPGGTFGPTTSGEVRFDEWASEQAVPVSAKLLIAPEDFPFLHQVAGHEESESIFTTWLRYKKRLQRN